MLPKPIGTSLIVVHMQHDGKSGSLNPQHCISEEIAGDPADNIFCPQAAITPLAAATVFKLPSGVVGKYNMLALIIADGARLWVCELPATRQFQPQECANAFEGDGAEAKHAATLANCHQSRTIDVVPEAFDLRMGGPPFSIEGFNFVIGETIRLKLSPGAKTAHVSKSQVAGFANRAFRRASL